jgi:starch phosphorylase
MFPGYHIESITNGVHSTFWTSDELAALYDQYLPGWRGDPYSLRYVLCVPKDKIWEAHQESKRKLFALIKDRNGVELDENIFTIGFARRAATYKRGDMLISDPERLKAIVEKVGKVQIVYAGKAHPKDGAGKDVIRNIFKGMQAIQDKIKVVYIEDYGIAIAKLMTAGVDVWLNTPMRPREASGTSGMKAAHNGVPHFSVLDGWWLEGHIEHVTGWSIGGHPNEVQESDQSADVQDLYNKLENDILPCYYNDHGKWVDIMRQTIAMNGSFFNTHRMLQQYVANAYFK